MKKAGRDALPGRLYPPPFFLSFSLHPPFYFNGCKSSTPFAFFAIFFLINYDGIMNCETNEGDSHLVPSPESTGQSPETSKKLWLAVVALSALALAEAAYILHQGNSEKTENKALLQQVEKKQKRIQELEKKLGELEEEHTATERIELLLHTERAYAGHIRSLLDQIDRHPERAIAMERIIVRAVPKVSDIRQQMYQELSKKLGQIQPEDTRTLMMLRMNQKTKPTVELEEQFALFMLTMQHEDKKDAKESTINALGMDVQVRVVRLNETMFAFRYPRTGPDVRQDIEKRMADIANAEFGMNKEYSIAFVFPDDPVFHHAVLTIKKPEKARRDVHNNRHRTSSFVSLPSSRQQQFGATKGETRRRNAHVPKRSMQQRLLRR